MDNINKDAPKSCEEELNKIRESIKKFVDAGDYNRAYEHTHYLERVEKKSICLLEICRAEITLLERKNAGMVRPHGISRAEMGLCGQLEKAIDLKDRELVKIICGLLAEMQGEIPQERTDIRIKALARNLLEKGNNIINEKE